MKILGIPFAAPLAVLVGFFDLIPLIGATIAAVLVGIVTVFADFPLDTIIWVIWAIVYQQLENSVIQPQIQRRAVDLHPFLVLVSVLFGSTLFGVAGRAAGDPGGCLGADRAGGSGGTSASQSACSPWRTPEGVPQCALAQKSSGRMWPACRASAKLSMRSSSTVIASASAAASIWALSRSSASSSRAQPRPPRAARWTTSRNWRVPPARRHGCRRRGRRAPRAGRRRVAGTWGTAADRG